jgi:aryl-alcohol dehydrogenase-like predicted oxidoreductase
MQIRNIGRLGPVSALTLGGGGIGGVWGSTERTEAVATVRAAIDAGITMLDVAPSYGDHEAEIVVGEALRAQPAPDVLITTKVGLPDAEIPDLGERMVSSLRASLDRLGRRHADLFLLHTQLRPAGFPQSAPPNTLGWERYLDEVVPMFERLRQEGSIRAWGLTGVGHPQSVLDAMRETRPDAAQIVVNALDLSGDMWIFGTDDRPRNAELMATAVDAGVSVIGIRAVAAGALSSTIDRPVQAEDPVAVDYAAAEPFRKLAAEFGDSPASLAHRYVLTVPDISTVILGVKNRAELTECLKAEARGGLTDAELQAVLQLRA